MTREEIVKKLKDANELTWISDMGYWGRVQEIEYWQKKLKEYDEKETSL